MYVYKCRHGILRAVKYIGYNSCLLCAVQTVQWHPCGSIHIVHKYALALLPIKSCGDIKTRMSLIHC